MDKRFNEKTHRWEWVITSPGRKSIYIYGWIALFWTALSVIGTISLMLET